MKRIINSMIVVLLLVSIVMVLVSLYNRSQEDNMLHAMKVACEADSHALVDNGLSDKCEALIAQVQAQGYEVLSNDNGEFWSEWNPQANQ